MGPDVVGRGRGVGDCTIFHVGAASAAEEAARAARRAEPVQPERVARIAGEEEVLAKERRRKATQEGLFALLFASLRLRRDVVLEGPLSVRSGARGGPGGDARLGPPAGRPLL